MTVLNLICLLTAVGAALAQNEDGERTDRVAVRLHHEADPHDIAALHGFKNLGPVGDLAHHYVFEKLPPEQHRSDKLATHIGEHEHVQWWCEWHRDLDGRSGVKRGAGGGGGRWH